METTLLPRDIITNIRRGMKRSKRRVAYLLLFLFLPIALAALYVRQPSFRSSAPSSATADPQALEQHVRRISTDFVPRSFRDHENLSRCADYISDQLTAQGARTSRQAYAVGRSTYHNVLGEYGPTSGPRIVVGAHYDAYGNHPGADDNASGVAGLLELGRLLHAAELPITVEVAAYCTEEPPYFGSTDMGSFHHAASLARSGADVRGMLSLEMIGYYDDRFGSQKYPLRLLNIFCPNTGNFIGVIGNTQQRAFTKNVKLAMKGTTTLPVISATVPASLTGVDFSDHRNYWAHGFHAVMVTDTAFYRNDAYHTENDTWDRLDYQRMSHVVVAVYEAILRLAHEQAGPG